jgi:hypothetical protein
VLVASVWPTVDGTAYSFDYRLVFVDQEGFLNSAERKYLTPSFERRAGAAEQLPGEYDALVPELREAAFGPFIPGERW